MCTYWHAGVHCAPPSQATIHMSNAMRADKDMSWTKWIMPIATCAGAIAISVASMGGSAPLAIAGCGPLVSKLARYAAQAATAWMVRRERREQLVDIAEALIPEMEKLDGLLVKLDEIASEELAACREPGATFDCAAKAPSAFDEHQLRNMRHIACLMDRLKGVTVLEKQAMTSEEEAAFVKYVATAKEEISEARAQMAALVTLATSLRVGHQDRMMVEMSKQLEGLTKAFRDVPAALHAIAHNAELINGKLNIQTDLSPVHKLGGLDTGPDQD